MRRATIMAIGLFVGLPAQAEPLRDLLLPLDCAPGVDCWAIRHVDHDPGPGERDYACGRLTGDGHKGTDFAIRDLAAMVEGVEVRAAAAGVVDALRDGMADVTVEEAGQDAVGGKECGNGIRLDHGEGWTTWYCHLRRGSLAVKQGDRVAAGDVLGMVGLSGDTSFPHLHFDVRRGDQVIDPFVGLDASEACGPGAAPLWAPKVMAQLPYRPVALTNVGVAPGVPEMADVRRGYHRTEALPVSAPALVLWAEAYWIESGDQLTFRLIGPDLTTVVDQTMTVEQGRRRWFQYVGKKRPGERWPAGAYVGTVKVERAGATSTRVALEHTVALR